MKNINKFLVLFVLSVFVITGIVRHFLQSDKVTSMISNKVTKDISKIFKADFKFKKIEIKLFPPATVLKQVRIIGKGKRKGRTLEANVGSFEIYFGLLDIFSRKTTISKIKIEDGKLLTSLLEEAPSSIKNEKDKKNEISSLFKKYQEDFMEEMPIKLDVIEMSKIDADIDGNKFLIEQCKLKLFEDKFILNLKAENIMLKDKLGKISMLNGKSFEIDALLKKKRLKIRDLKVRDKFDVYGYQGHAYEKQGEIMLKGEAYYHGGIANMMKLAGINIDINGLVEAAFKISDNINDLKIAYMMDIKDFESKWGNFQKIKLSGVKDKKYLILKSLKIEDLKSTAVSIGNSVLYDFSSKKILENGMRLSLKNFYSNKALYVVKDSLKILKGYFTGEIAAYYIDNVISFVFKPDFEIKDFRLVSENEKDIPIIANPRVMIEKGKVDVLKNGSVDIYLKMLLKDTVLEAKGNIDRNGVLLESKKHLVNLESIGPISGVSLKGKGYLKFKVSGGHSNINFFFNSTLEKAYVPGYNLGKLNSQLIYNIKKNTLTILKMEGVNGSSSYKGDGLLNFNNKDILLNIKFNNSYYNDFFDIYEDIFDHPDISRDVSLIYNTAYKVTGKMQRDKIKVEGKINGKGLSYKDEVIDSFKGNFFYKNDKILFENGTFKKSKGLIKLSVTYDFSNKIFDYDMRFSNVRLRDLNIYEKLNLGYDADISGYFKGNTSNKKNTIKSKFNFTKGNIDKITTPDSFLAISNEGKKVHIRGNFLGDIINFDSNLDLSSRKKSHFNTAIMADDIRILAGLLSSHNTYNQQLRGLLSARLNSQFRWNELSKISLLFSLDEFQLKKNKIHLIGKGKNKILIKEGSIKNWNIILGGNNGKVISNGSGDFSNKYNVETNFNLRADLFELIFPIVQKIEGVLKGKYIIKGSGNSFSSHFTSNGNIESLKILKIPKFFSDIKYRMVVDNNELVLQDLKGKYGEGVINMDGKILFQLPTPKINLSFVLDNSFIPLIKKSGVVVSGNGKITGKSTPYLISGDFSILHGNVIDEFEEIFSANKGEIEHSKYIPQKAFEKKINYFSNDLNVQFSGPVSLKNRHADLAFDGEVNIRGAPGLPLFSGFLKIIPNESKFTFKGHDFNLKKGRVNFKDDSKKKPAVIDFSGESKVNEYTIRLDLRGETKELDFLLRSEPPLSQQDIFSLLTLGITTEKTDNLEESDKQSIISVGLGSLLADQLKLGKGLNSSLGIRFSILPELSEDKSSKIQGKVSNKLKSSTKIKLEKKISEKVDLSVSSTVGGSLEQKQEVNIKLNLNENLSVQGVYESRTSNDDEEGSGTSDSVGFDFIFKRTYK